MNLHRYIKSRIRSIFCRGLKKQTLGLNSKINIPNPITEIGHKGASPFAKVQNLICSARIPAGQMDSSIYFSPSMQHMSQPAPMGASYGQNFNYF
jgi:hypothetical protein